MPLPGGSTLPLLPVHAQVPGRYVTAGAAGPLEPLVGPVDLCGGSVGGVAGGVCLAVEQHVVAGGFRGLGGERLRHGARRSSTGPRQQSGAAAPVPERIRAGTGGVLKSPVVSSEQQPAAAPVAEEINATGPSPNGCRLPPERQLAALQVPEGVGAAAAGFLATTWRPLRSRI